MFKNNQVALIQFIIFLAFLEMTLPYPTITPLVLLNYKAEAYVHFLRQFNPKQLTTIILSAYPLGLFLGSLIIGSLADKFSKRKLLLTSLILSSLTQLICGIIIVHKMFFWLIGLRLLAGMCEGNMAIARASLAVLAKTEKLKLKIFGRANVALTLGWACGPVIGGSISALIPSANFKFSIPYFISSGLSLVLFFIVLANFTEPTLKIRKRTIDKHVKQNAAQAKRRTVNLMLTTLCITLGALLQK